MGEFFLGVILSSARIRASFDLLVTLIGIRSMKKCPIVDSHQKASHNDRRVAEPLRPGHPSTIEGLLPGNRVLLVGPFVFRGNIDLAGLCLLADRDDDTEHAVVVAGAYVLGIDALPETELPQVGTGRPLLNEPLRSFLSCSGSLRPDGQQLAVHVYVDRARVDSWEVRVENVVIAIPVQVDRHEARARAELEQAPRQAVQLAERIERHSHDENSPFLNLSPCDSTTKNISTRPKRVPVGFSSELA